MLSVGWGDSLLNFGLGQPFRFLCVYTAKYKSIIRRLTILERMCLFMKINGDTVYRRKQKFLLRRAYL